MISNQTKSKKLSNGLKIMSWNINGIRAVIKKGFLDFINEEEHDIICIQETKMQEAQMPLEFHNH